MRSTIPGGAFFVLWIASSGAVAAQDMVDTFRGDEIDDRDFELKKQHFLNILSYDFDLAAEREWDRARSGYRGIAGSLDSQNIYLYQEMKMHAEAGETIAARMHLLQAEDFDSRFLRFTLEPEARLGPNWRVGVPVQILPEKEDVDLGLALTYEDRGIDYLKLVYLAQNLFFNSETEQNREYNRNPGTVALQWSAEAAEGLWTKGTVGQVLPLSWEIGDQHYTFEFTRFFYRQHAQLAIDRESDLYLVISGEQTAKHKDYVPILNSQDNDLHRSAVKIRTEYRRRFGFEETRAGLQVLSVRESDVLPNLPSGGEFVRRREYVPYFGYRFPVAEKTSLEIAYFFALQNNETEDVFTGFAKEEDDEPISKVSFAMRWDFSPRVHLVINPTLQFFGPTPYGGTGVQFVATF